MKPWNELTVGEQQNEATKIVDTDVYVCASWAVRLIFGQAYGEWDSSVSDELPWDTEDCEEAIQSLYYGQVEFPEPIVKGTSIEDWAGWYEFTPPQQDSMVENIEEVIEGWDEEICRLDEEITALGEENSSLDDDVQAIEEEIDQMVCKTRDDEVRFQKLSGDSEYKREEIDRNSEEIQMLTEQKEDLESRKDSLEDILEEVRNVDWDQHEVFEVWIVSGWLGRRLQQEGEAVINSSYGMWWLRCTTGQSINMDGVIERIAREQYEEVLKYHTPEKSDAN